MYKNIITDYVKTANYITFLQMYLNEFPKNNDLSFKKYVPGHWGCSPSINDIYATLSYFAKKNKIEMQIVIGTGHSGCSVMSNLFLQNRLHRYNINYNKKGLNKLINYYGDKIRTEINPGYPTTIYDGGELGYSLAFSYGVALNNKIFIPCIIGDGEAETSTLCASWQLNDLLKNRVRGNVLPIINLNGLKMESSSYLSSIGKNRIKKLFEGYGYKVIFAKYSNLYISLKKAYNYKKKKTILIYSSTKGKGLPNYNNTSLEGTRISHKNPLSFIDSKDKNIYLEKWNHKLKPNKYLTKENIYQFHYKNPTFLKTKLKLNNIHKYLIVKDKCSNVETLDNYLSDVLNNNPKFLITSPDELISNKFIKTANCNNIIEILNENICQLLQQGNIMTGGNGVIISYESFIPITTSILSQFCKYIYQFNKINKNKKLSSLNYILTSTCFENNYSHQNPEFVSNILNKEWDFINCYYPKDANSALFCLEKSLKSTGSVNIITISKANMEQYNSDNIEMEILKEEEEPDIIFVATGDYILQEVLIANKYLEKKEIKTKVVYVTNISLLKRMSKENMQKYFNCKNIIYCYQGYASLIRGIFSRYNVNLIVLGYKDMSDICGNYLKKMKYNKLDSKSIISFANKIMEED